VTENGIAQSPSTPKIAARTLVPPLRSSIDKTSDSSAGPETESSPPMFSQNIPRSSALRTPASTSDKPFRLWFPIFSPSSQPSRNPPSVQARPKPREIAAWSASRTTSDGPKTLVSPLFALSFHATLLWNGRCLGQEERSFKTLRSRKTAALIRNSQRLELHCSSNKIWLSILNFHCLSNFLDMQSSVG